MYYLRYFLFNEEYAKCLGKTSCFCISHNWAHFRGKVSGIWSAVRLSPLLLFPLYTLHFSTKRGAEASGRKQTEYAWCLKVGLPGHLTCHYSSIMPKPLVLAL